MTINEFCFLLDRTLKIGVTAGVINSSFVVYDTDEYGRCLYYLQTPNYAVLDICAYMAGTY